VTEEREPGARSPTRALAAAAVAVYVLVVAGATAAVADAAAAGGTWPTCQGAALGDPGVAVAWAHRLTAVLAGLLVVTAAVAVWRRRASRRVKAAATLAAALYPLQVGIGALAATSGGAATFAGAHLSVGVAIFGGVVVALAWQLEAETADLPDPLDEPSGEAPEPIDGDATPTDPAGGLGATAMAYVRLTKPKLWWLLCMVAAAGMALASGMGADLSVRVVVLTLGGGVLSIAASGTFNHVLERDVDRRMQRTADRPVATD
jgi:protoheme IX farnesyltransferase